MMKVWTEEEGCHILNAKFDFDTLMNTDVNPCEDRETDSTQTDGVRRGYVLIILIFKVYQEGNREMLYTKLSSNQTSFFIRYGIQVKEVGT